MSTLFVVRCSWSLNTVGYTELLAWSLCKDPFAKHINGTKYSVNINSSHCDGLFMWTFCSDQCMCVIFYEATQIGSVSVGEFPAPLHISFTFDQHLIMISFFSERATGWQSISFKRNIRELFNPLEQL